jgi:hypothetical protein
MSKYGTQSTFIGNTTPALKPQYPFPGKRLTFVDTYTASSLTNDNVILAHVRTCDIVVGGRVYWAALGSGVTLTCGDNGNCSRFMTTAVATSSNISNQLDIGCGSFNVLAGIGFQYDHDCDVFVGVGSTAATGQITLVLDVIRPGV